VSPRTLTDILVSLMEPRRVIFTSQALPLTECQLSQNWAGDLKLQAARSIIETVRKVFHNCRVFREEMASEDIKEAKMDFTNMVSFHDFPSSAMAHLVVGCFLVSLFLRPGDVAQANYVPGYVSSLPPLPRTWSA